MALKNTHPKLNLKRTFNKIAKLYNEIRPDYPSKTIKAIAKAAQLNPKTSKLLDVGCGSGQLTIPFAKSGFHITGVDLSPELIALAEAKAKGLPVQFIADSFENAELPKENFNGIIFSQSFHWIDPAVALPKVYRLLKPHGVAILTWQFFGESSLVKKIDKGFVKFCPQYPKSAYGQTDKYVQQLRKFRKFTEIKSYHWKHTISYTKTKLVKLLHTFSFISSLDGESKEKFDQYLQKILKNEKETIKLPYRTTVLLAFK